MSLLAWLVYRAPMTYKFFTSILSDASLTSSISIKRIRFPKDIPSGIQRAHLVRWNDYNVETFVPIDKKAKVAKR